MDNYFKDVIRQSQYLKIFIMKFFGDNRGTESYTFLSDIIEMAENVDDKILHPKILKEFVWYYNLFISKDTRANIDLKELKRDLKKFRK